MADPVELLATRFSAAIAAALGPEHAGTDPVLRPADPRFGDYQANFAMGLTKRIGRPPRDIASEVVDHLDLGGVARNIEIAGPGFVNITLDEGFLAGQVAAVARDSRLGVPVVAPSQVVLVDYSSPNVAKEMHVGHLRTTVIGDALVRIAAYLGHRVVRQNHLGDWGTQFGMLIEHLVDLGWDETEAGPQAGDAARSIEDLNELYRQAQEKFRTDPDFGERARRRVVLLQGGHEGTLRLWRELVEESERHFERVYQRLGILLEPGDVAGESFYNDQLDETVDELSAKGILRLDQGALCAFPAGFTGRDGEPLPMIVRKSDGGYGYDATDLAALRYRVRVLGAEELLYVVGAPQTQHFAMLFAVGRQAGWLGEAARAVHVSFGSVLGEDGRPFKTRSGDNIRLADLLDEAVARAGVIVEEKRPDLDPATRLDVARAVGIGAVKYADLANDRVKDYVFSWDRLLAFDGNTAPYLQYAHARIQSIFRRASAEGADFPQAEADGTAVLLDTPAERALALALLSLPSALAAAAEGHHPHKVAGYLFDLAQAFTTFFEACSVLRAETAELRASRLLLADLTARILALGLGLLGIEAPDQM